MNCELFWSNITTNLIAGLIIFFFGLFYPSIPKSINKIKLICFWGRSVLKESFLICYSALLDSRIIPDDSSDRKSKTGSTSPQYSHSTSSYAESGSSGTSGYSSPDKSSNEPENLNLRYVKKYHDGRSINVVGPWGEIVGSGEIRAASYLLNVISPFRKSAIHVEPDSVGIKDLNRTIICLGSSSTNELTDLILREENNKFFRFGQENEKTFIEDIKNNKKYFGFENPYKKDYGIIMKMKNLRFPNHFFFVCAGLGEWGTSGACWYLSKYWRTLSKTKQAEFGILLEIELNSDSSAKPAK